MLKSKGPKAFRGGKSSQAAEQDFEIIPEGAEPGSDVILITCVTLTLVARRRLPRGKSVISSRREDQGTHSENGFHKSLLPLTVAA